MDRLTLSSCLCFHFNLSRPFLLGKGVKRWKDLSAYLLGSVLWVLFDGGFAHVWQFERRAGCINIQVEKCRHERHLWMTTVLQFWMEGGFCGTIRCEKTCDVSGKGDLVLHKWTRGDNWAEKCLVLHKEDEVTKCSAMSVRESSAAAWRLPHLEPCGPSILSVSR